MRQTVKGIIRGAGTSLEPCPIGITGSHSVTGRVAILMCTFNGAAYLKEQLESFAAQTFSDWVLYVSDDASTDDTCRILSEYQARWGAERLVILKGPCQGFASNFISLVQRRDIIGDYFAFSDQDDVWFSDKLARSLSCLSRVGETTPALYCARTCLVDADNNIIGKSPLFARPPSFQNALVQSLAGANTMLINRAARDLLLELPDDSPIVAHDWLTYLLVTGCGGEVIYDAQPGLYYRQHGGNLIGANATFMDRLARLRGMLSGRFIKWNDANLQVLFGMITRLSESNKRVLGEFAGGRQARLFKRLSALRRAGVYRQTLQGNLSLWLAILLGRL
ncbi:glycosyltransferase family 2 protein [Pseudomonas sp. JDS28PS106]|uniref:glycosyltransferase family 2 protein n=1 Tax=Pseudomonas sp. JDS28PS106 TaxID=2497235 RepID=UPI002FD71546